MKKLLISLALVAGFLTAGASMASAAGCSQAFPVASGGTGWCAFQSTFIPFGNGTSPLATSTAFFFTNSLSRLTVTNASTTAITATNASSTNLTISSTGTGASKCLKVDGAGNVSAASADCATGGTPGGTSGQVQYNASGAFGGVATNTLSGTSNQITVTNSPVVIAASPSVLSIPNPFIITSIVANGSSTIGNGTQGGGLTIVGGATTTNATTTTLAITGTSASNCNGTSALTTTSAGIVTCTAQPQGTVTAVSVASANGFAGSSSGGATPALTLTTTITGILQGNGTAISAIASSTFFTGTTGQVGFFQTSGNLIGTSSLFIAANGDVLVGTTTDVAGETFQIGNRAGASRLLAEMTSINTGTGAGSALVFGHPNGAVNTADGAVGNPSAFFNSAADMTTALMSVTGLGFFTNNTSVAKGLFATNGEFGLATSSPFARLSIQANPNDPTRDGILFAIASSTASATTTVFSTTSGGQTASCETVFGKTANGADYASSTAMRIDFQATCNQVLLQVGGAAFTVTAANAKAGDTKRIVIQNPGATAGAVTWAGLVWLGGTTPTQTTTSNGGDVYSCLATQASSTAASTVKIECNQGAGIQ